MSLIIFIVKNDSIINLFLSLLLFIFCFSLKRPIGSYELNSQSICMGGKKKKIHVNLPQQLNILLCACVHVYVCIRAFRVAVLGACSVSPPAHGSCIISSEHATATGILRLCSLCLSICLDTLQSRSNSVLFGSCQSNRR